MPPASSHSDSQADDKEGEEFVVKIFDQSFTLFSKSGKDQDVKRAAVYLDGRMRKLATSRHRAVPLELAILTAMQIADEVISAQRQREQLLAAADERIGRFTQSMDAGRSPDTTSPD